MSIVDRKGLVSFSISYRVGSFTRKDGFLKKVTTVCHTHNCPISPGERVSYISLVMLETLLRQ